MSACDGALFVWFRWRRRLWGSACVCAGGVYLRACVCESVRAACVLMPIKQAARTLCSEFFPWQARGLRSRERRRPHVSSASGRAALACFHAARGHAVGALPAAEASAALVRLFCGGGAADGGVGVAARLFGTDQRRRHAQTRNAGSVGRLDSHMSIVVRGTHRIRCMPTRVALR